MVQCTRCGIWACRTGELDKLPTQGFCPMRIHEEVLKEAREIYNDPDIRKFSQVAARVEATGYCKWSRVKETMEFASRLGVQKLGIASCIGLRREATILAKIFKANGFEIASILCKSDSFPKEEIGLEDVEKIQPGSYETVCNPVGQAMVLNAEKTGLNVIIGLCVGHDSLFIKHSKAPVTCLVVKDRVLAHNPVGALYTASSYYQQKLFEAHKSK
ncbi:MAG: DUF1847 domain-containing protein [Candidatus Heimdallarchaeota archaeon]